MPDIDGGEGWVGAFLDRASTPDRLFARFDGAPLTVNDLQRQSAALASYLRAHGIEAGARVAVMLRNSPAAVAVVLGLARAGVIWVPVNVQLRGDGLRYILEHSAPALLIADADLLPVVTECGAMLPPVLEAEANGGALADVLAGEAHFSAPVPGPDDIFAISYTSGTTGRPKGVQVSHRMLRLAGEAVAQIADVRGGDVLFHWEPLVHIGGMQMLVLPLIRDCHLAMVSRFSASRFWQQVRDARATHIHYLGGVLQLLLKQPPGPWDRTHGVRVAWGGGCPTSIWRAFEERFGLRLREAYGMTEASSITTCNVDGVLGAVGRPLPWFSIDLLDDAGTPVANGERGEIVVRTTVPGAIFRGYFRDPETTAGTLRNGALHTGDIGSWGPDGQLRFHGRRTDSLRCRGENVSAWEVEHVVAMHPDVEDCAVIGVPAEIGEQDVKLFVQPRPGCHIDPAALSAWLQPRLASYQNPRYVVVLERFHRTPSERIMKHVLSRRTDDCWDRLAPVEAAS